MKNWFYFFLGACCITITFIVVSTGPQANNFSAFKASAVSDVEQDSFIQNVHSPKIPEQIELAGEFLPKDNFDALERFDRELISNCFRHSGTFLYFKRAKRYFPIIEPILKANGIPDDLKYLAVAESQLTNAISPAGAKGFWQFMKSSATERGLEVNDEVDERYHLEKATQAACDYLNEAKKQFGSWFLAAASYNMGKAGLEKAMKKQKAEKYFDLNLNSETSRYVLRILAIKTIMEAPQTYGFHLDEQDYYPAMPKYINIEINNSIEDLADFAKVHKISYRMLKLYNPWLISYKLTNKSNRKYLIRIPIQ